MNLNKSTPITLTIEKLAFPGKSIAYLTHNENKMVVFLDEGLPGDQIEAQISKIKKNYLEAKVTKYLKNSPEKITPKCIHFEKCGGCIWQNLIYENQLKYKNEFVAETLKHLGNQENYELKKIIPCDNQFYYRNKMEFSFGYDQENKFSIGLHQKHRKYDILNIENCLLESEESNIIRNEISTFCQEKNLIPYNFKENSGLLRSLFIREGKNTKEILVNFAISHENFEFEEALIKLIEKINQKLKEKQVTSLYLTKISVQKGRRTTIEEKLLFGNKILPEEMGVLDKKLKFAIHPQSFFQPNTIQAQKLYAEIIKSLELKGSEIVYDLFCGTGTISLFTALFTKKVYGIELSEDAIHDAIENAKLNQIKNIEFICGDCTKEIKNLTEKPDAIIIDPPRSGLNEKLIEKIIAYNSPKILYVSCNPATQARDLKIFTEKKYKLKFAQPIDMFPNTYHIENIAYLEKK
ncbi:23S rRNA (uracil-5-)-methyltransferase RumA [Candidatus Peregrinibacteria bacterium RIFOXYC2_FULL_33_13]|nr:MAG: RNA methyltransferase, TrmA family [Candidatus Peregrinibacteria bacterium GW2011_GWA2_33_10]KKP38187.1 MAG: hypothetical protein UR30_C0023G0004 [Candidatus Peregrinibacteria bacterium GW2011_GWC2_33_13]OGJ48772.1 MAG: 23S rRNA (uracil-5-)-methyltransferase RumA [Candidatus Peregrinibacteria bacterium RIFOXYA2_FULL_33_7]OGJ52165.1 MAG: 23S rRNA (uracil-5-)-methyltransferase RumA [Candidatus Peregrinibacteria bacterium RIFOXYC2_FULL_33_13]